jgi:hypothetical protein
MFNIFSKNNGKKGQKTQKARGAKAKSGKKSGAKAKAQGKAKAKAGAKTKAAAPAKPESQGIVLQDIPALPMPKRPKPPDAGQSLDAAKAALQSDKLGAQTPAGRKKLIAQALAVHNVQSRLLDELDPDTKQRLRALAMQKLILERNK